MADLFIKSLGHAKISQSDLQKVGDNWVSGGIVRTYLEISGQKIKINYIPDLLELAQLMKDKDVLAFLSSATK